MCEEATWERLGVRQENDVIALFHIFNLIKKGKERNKQKTKKHVGCYVRIKYLPNKRKALNLVPTRENVRRSHNEQKFRTTGI